MPATSLAPPTVTRGQLSIAPLTISRWYPPQGESEEQTKVLAVDADGTLTETSIEFGMTNRVTNLGRFTASGEAYNAAGKLVASIAADGTVQLPGFEAANIRITDTGTVGIVEGDARMFDDLISWNDDGSLAGQMPSNQAGYLSTSNVPAQARRLASFMLLIERSLRDSATDSETKAEQPAATIAAPAVAPLLADCPME